MRTSSLRLSSIAASIALIGQFTGALIIPNNATAADMLVDESYEYTDVEFGTGWYLRGDVGGGILEATAEANFLDGEAELGTPVSFSAGAGYTFAEGLRAEVSFNQFNNLAFSTREATGCGTEDHDGDSSPVDVPDGFGGLLATAPIPVTGECFLSANGRLSASSLMANAYADLGTYWGIRPYLGAGVGAAYLTWTDANISNMCLGSDSIDCGAGGGLGSNSLNVDNYETQSSWALAANAMLGVSYELSRGLNLDLGYRYTYIGESDVARAADNPGEYIDVKVGNLSIHEVRLGLRYEIW